MRIIDESGNWDLIYEQVSLKLDKNRLYAYPLYTNLLTKPIFLKSFVNEEEGKRMLMDIRHARRANVAFYYVSERIENKEYDYISRKLQQGK